MIKKGDEDAMLLTDDLSLVPTVSHLDPHITKKALAEIRADLLQTQRLLRKQHQSTPSEERDSLRAMKEFVARAQVGVAADHASARARACVCVCVWVCVWVCVGVCVCALPESRCDVWIQVKCDDVEARFQAATDAFRELRRYFGESSSMGFPEFFSTLGSFLQVCVDSPCHPCVFHVSVLTLCM